MGDIFNVFKELRQKGIDANQVDLLKSAYEHQNLNLEQLKENNSALRESNDLFKTKIAKLEIDSISLQEEILALKKKIPIGQKTDLSEGSLDVLNVLNENDIVEFYESDMTSLLQKGKVFAQTAMGELRNNNFIIQSKTITDARGTGYRVTQEGLEYMARLGELNG